MPLTPGLGLSHDPLQGDEAPAEEELLRGKMLHARNRHLRSHRGFSVAVFPWSLSGIFQWNFTFVISGVYIILIIITIIIVIIM